VVKLCQGIGSAGFEIDEDSLGPEHRENPVQPPSILLQDFREIKSCLDESRFILADTVGPLNAIDSPNSNE